MSTYDKSDVPEESTDQVKTKQEPVQPYRSKRPYAEAVETYIDKHGGLSGAIDNSKLLYRNNKLKLEKYKYKVILPGHFYIFEYLDYDLAKDVKAEKVNTPYYNFTPLVFAFKSKNENVFGIDINGLHPIKRKQLFINFTKFFAKTIEYNIESKPITNWKPIPIDGTNYFRLLKLKNKSIINNYDRKYIRNLHIVKWEDVVPASLLYLDQNFVFNSKKEINLKTLFNSQL